MAGNDWKFRLGEKVFDVEVGEEKSKDGTTYVEMTGGPKHLDGAFMDSTEIFIVCDKCNQEFSYLEVDHERETDCCLECSDRLADIHGALKKWEK